MRFTIASVFALLISIYCAAPSLALPVAAPLSTTKITSAFGYRVHPVTNKYSFHNGVDYRAKLNDEVKAVMPGVVVKAGWRGNLGKAVEIYHPEKKLRTIYGHLNKIQVKKGEHLVAGSTIGGAGTTGRSTGVHLHLIAKEENGSYIDSSKIIANSETSAPAPPLGDTFAVAALDGTSVAKEAVDTAIDGSADARGFSVDDSIGSLFISTVQNWLSAVSFLSVS